MEVERPERLDDLKCRFELFGTVEMCRIEKETRKVKAKKSGYDEVEPVDWMDDLDRIWWKKGEMKEILKRWLRRWMGNVGRVDDVEIRERPGN